MLVPGILGFQYIVLGCLLCFCLVIRQKWKNAAEKKEEVMRMLAAATEEAAIFEAQAVTEYSCYPQPYQCAVCFCPTTMRCSGCKSVRYCSGKCQIIHWRRGHKDECHPATDFAAQKQSDMYSNDSGVEGEFKESPKTSLVEEVEAVNGKNEKGMHKVFPASGRSSSSDVAHSYDFDTDTPKCVASPKKTAAIHDSSGSDLINCKDNLGTLDKNNTELGKEEDMIEEAHLIKETNKNSAKEACSKTLATEASKKTGLPSSNGSKPYLTNDREDKSVRFSSHEASSDNPIPSLASRSRLVTSSNSISPANGNGLASFPQNACNGLKTSMQKVVQQFRAPKQLKSSLLGSGNEVTGKSNYKINFPYELFVELYSNPVELCPFGLINCGNSCYANAVLQCLAFTRPLTSYLIQGFHSRACRKKDWCFICEFECLILKGREDESPVSPIKILSKIKKIGSHLARGKEEDAHEFLSEMAGMLLMQCNLFASRKQGHQVHWQKKVL